MPKPNLNVSTSYKWTAIVLILSFALSVFFSFVTSAAMESLEIGFAFILLLVIIAVNILFDMIGTAVQSAEEKPFHSLSSRKVPGARESISVIRHAPQLANMCCDVIGDIAGIISGATTALIVAELVAMFNLKGMLPSLILTGLVGALTIGRKALSKGISLQNGNTLEFRGRKRMYFFQHLKK
ncbi:MAG: hypothetical protein LIO59_03390 [Oscillospiraceae bacterium]|nr:hypothetical protein [Oscillospiraceae bacterium]